MPPSRLSNHSLPFFPLHTDLFHQHCSGSHGMSPMVFSLESRGSPRTPLAEIPVNYSPSNTIRSASYAGQAAIMDLNKQLPQGSPVIDDLSLSPDEFLFSPSPSPVVDKPQEDEGPVRVNRVLSTQHLRSSPDKSSSITTMRLPSSTPTQMNDIFGEGTNQGIKASGMGKPPKMLGPKQRSHSTSGLTNLLPRPEERHLASSISLRAGACADNESSFPIVTLDGQNDLDCDQGSFSLWGPL
jgi:hypothetical protein